MALTLPSATRIRIIASAIQSFAARGYASASIREITARAGSNSSLVTYHFGGKAGLYRETMRFILERRGASLVELVRRLPTGPGAPRPDVIRGLQEYIRKTMELLLPAGPVSPLEDASMVLLARELEMPTAEFAPVLEEFIRPIAAYMDQALASLRPDLEEPARFAMSLSIQGQMMYLRNALGVLRLVRGDPGYPRDLGALIRHFTGFSLRGLGLPEAGRPCGPAYLPVP
jgi:AcrR family transcriptional regulator